MSYPSVEPPVSPAQPIADGSRPIRRRVLQAVATDFARFIATMLCCAVGLVVFVEPRVVAWENQRAKDAEVERLAAARADERVEMLLSKNAEVERLAEERVESLLKSINDGIDVMTPPTNDKLFTILTKGITTGEDVVRTDTVSATPKAMFATDLTTYQQTDAWTQEIVVQNLDVTVPADNLCIGAIPWTSAGATCTLKCAASGLTCSGAATDGVRTSSWQRRYDGTNCLCVVGSAAVVNYQSERVLR